MQTKICFLFALILFIILQSIAANSSNRKDRKKTYNYDDDDDVSYGAASASKYDTDASKYGIDLAKYGTDVAKYEADTSKYNDISEGSSYRRNRYPSSSQRSRSRWSSSSSPYEDTDDWSSSGYGINNILSGFGGPLAPPAYDTGAYLGGGPGCYPLLDPQYPMFSDICGVVPQARYSLPNSFGHMDRWQIAQTLSIVLNPTTNPVCARSLRLLLCPLLFPPCPTRFEPPPLIPCQSYCQMVKGQCANPALDLLPCEILPPVSDFCPINPTPYSSLLASFAQPFPLNTPLPAGPFNGPLPPSPALSQSPLSALLAQSALQGSLSFPSDVPPSMFPSLASPPTFPSMWSPLTSPNVPTPGASSGPFSSLLSSPSVSSPPFSPLLSSPGLPSPPFSSPLSSPGLSSLLSSFGAPPASLSSFLSPLSPALPMDPYHLADTLTPILVDFPPSRYGQDYRQQPSRYFPLRSASEKV